MLDLRLSVQVSRILSSRCGMGWNGFFRSRQQDCQSPRCSDLRVLEAFKKTRWAWGCLCYFLHINYDPKYNDFLCGKQPPQYWIQKKALYFTSFAYRTLILRTCKVRPGDWNFRLQKLPDYSYMSWQGHFVRSEPLVRPSCVSKVSEDARTISIISDDVKCRWLSVGTARRAV